MIAIAHRTRRRHETPTWQTQFLTLLPAIRRQAHLAFRSFSPAAREDLIQEVVANCVLAFHRLVVAGKAERAYPSVLARYAIAQIRVGRRVGQKMTSWDVLSRRAQRARGFTVQRLDHVAPDEGEWIEAVAEDQRTPVADQAAFRIDFAAWLATYSSRVRRIAQALATGYTTTEVARRFGVSPGRISQLRRLFQADWHNYQREPASRVD